MRINTLALLLGLMSSIHGHAGVTDSDITAYRWGLQDYVIFTDNPGDDPNSADAPLGSGVLGGTYECRPASGAHIVAGLVCNGSSGAPVADYICDSTPTPNAGNTTWCLFSENPRTGSKAWAIKYVNGLIPTNDGASIVRCQGTDIFDSENGCRQPPSEISIEGGFINLDTTDGNAPLDADCAITAHNGRMVVDDVNDRLYICTANGWIFK